MYIKLLLKVISDKIWNKIVSIATDGDQLWQEKQLEYVFS